MSLINELKKSGFSFNKNLGQNFLLDENYLQSVVSSLCINKNYNIIEIGTGAGTLTRVLARNFDNITTFEIDNRLKNVLTKQFDGFNNIKLVFEDALKSNYFKDLNDFSVVANIPYYITTPLLMKFIKYQNCKSICVLVQDDVANRIVAKPGNKDYGALSVTLQLWGDCKILKNVPRNLFVPAPNVDSAFVQISRHSNHEPFDNKLMERLLKGLFAARRKNILNGLSQTLNINKETAREILNKIDITDNTRPEQLEPKKFVEMIDIISKNS